MCFQFVNLEILKLRALIILRVSAGTAHGFALFDYIQKKAVMSKCTLNPNGKCILRVFIKYPNYF